MLLRIRIFACLCIVILLSGLSGAQEATPQPGMTIHVVQRGETLYRIASSYGLTYEQLAKVNGITNPNNIQVGQRLLITLDPVPEVVPPKTHIVQPGDTLKSIAEVFEVDEQKLIALNGITNPNMLYVGQVLTIVPEEAITGVEPETVDIAAPPLDGEVEDTSDGANDVIEVQTLADNTNRHVVKAGDTLFRIATQYGVTMADLQAANNIDNAEVIYAGQELIIPGVEPIESTVRLPAAITALDVTPLTLTEGKTSRIRVTTRGAATVTATFLERSLPVIPLENNVYLMWAAVPLGTTGGIYPFNLEIVEASGETTPFTFNIQIETGVYGRGYVQLPADKVDLVSKSVEDNELNLLASITSPFNPDRYFDGPMGLPLAAALNGPFGVLRSYNGGPFEHYHIGSDFAGAAGSPILAAAAGRVVMADALNIRGNAVIIDHGWGVYTNYSHMSVRNVNLGDFVQAGQVIGAVGSSGRVEGPHLHWELWVNGTAVDPLQWVYQAFP